MILLEGLRLNVVKDKVNGCSWLGDDVKGNFDLVVLAKKHHIFRVPAMGNKFAPRLDALDDEIDGKNEHEETGRVILLSFLLAAHPLVAKALVRLAFRV